MELKNYQNKDWLFLVIKILIFINYSTGKIIKKIETEVMGTCFENINDSILLMGYFNGNI